MCNTPLPSRLRCNAQRAVAHKPTAGVLSAPLIVRRLSLAPPHAWRWPRHTHGAGHATHMYAALAHACVDLKWRSFPPDFSSESFSNVLILSGKVETLQDRVGKLILSEGRLRHRLDTATEVASCCTPRHLLHLRVDALQEDARGQLARGPWQEREHLNVKVSDLSAAAANANAEAEVSATGRSYSDSQFACSDRGAHAAFGIDAGGSGYGRDAGGGERYVDIDRNRRDQSLNQELQARSPAREVLQSKVQPQAGG